MPDSVPSLPSAPRRVTRFVSRALLLAPVSLLVLSPTHASLHATTADGAPQAMAASAAAAVTSPKEQFGFSIGDDYQLATYEQLTAYWKKLDAQSDRMTLVDIGKTAEGRSQWMAIITSPENHRKLERIKAIARRLALAEDVTTEAEARTLAAEGKAVVWIDGGLHATETLGAQQLIETVYQLVSGTDAETRRVLDDTVVLAVHANPDGHELVANWYLRESDPKKRSLNFLPRLYQKYAGHDNNRDSYMAALNESANMNRVLYREWYPQIMYNHHQTGPLGTVMFAPPFRDPFNYVYDPLIPTSLDLVGAAMHTRFAAEGKPGVTMRRGSNYSTWWNGGLRTTVYFHNMIGLLTETIGSPTPMSIPFRPERQLPSADLPFPIEPQTWHMRQSIEYSLTANRAVLDLASRYREQFLFNIWRMARNSIERGNRDTWTTYPRRLQKLPPSTPVNASGGEGANAGPSRELFTQVLRDPALRDPRGYILPADQADFPTAIAFVNALIRAGVTIHKASAPFSVQGKSYPAGSLVVKTAQAFRPHVLDMFEPQDHPDDFQYPGGPPIPPYDSAGWTLAFQMGVQVDRILEGFDGPFEKVADQLTIVPGTVTGPTTATAYVFPHTTNQAFRAINRLLKAGEQVTWLPDGRFRVAAGRATRGRLTEIATATGVSFEGVAGAAPQGGQAVRPVRLALWDRYGGSMPSGWLRLVLEEFEFPYEVVYPSQVDAGVLASRFDAVILPDGAIPEREGGFGSRMPNPASVPAEYRERLGNYSNQTTLPALRGFLEQGGTVLTIGSATSLAAHLGLPVGNKLVDAGRAPLKAEQYYVPGSVLRVKVDTTQPLAHGLRADTDVYFDNSPVFTLPADAAARGITPIAWFDTPTPLRSGWAWGQKYLDKGVAIAEARVGKGTLVLFGPEITFRAQPHGTFKFLFNGIYRTQVAASREGSPEPASR
ncbi:MAG TPA: M14 metallopeptidase family protein [Luteitalea sp.]|nr:M14 metallopeptidase family protein [Luteitalea sp.]